MPVAKSSSSAGSFNSPQLLQLSGIGPADAPEATWHSRSSPIVRPLVIISAIIISRGWCSRLKAPLSLNDAVRQWHRGAAALFRYAFFRRGYFAMPALAAGCFLRALPTAATPDVQCSLMLFSVKSMGRGIASLLRASRPYAHCCGRKVAVMSASESADPHAAACDRSELSRPRRKIATRWLRDQGAAPDR